MVETAVYRDGDREESRVGRGHPPVEWRFGNRPDQVEVSLRQKDDRKIYFLLNHQNTPVRITFYKPMHDFLTGSTFSGNYDLPPHGVLVLDEHAGKA